MKVIYIFNSVPPDRPAYKRGVLDALCYPPGHTMVMSYRKSYFQLDLLVSKERLLGKEAIFVFLDRDPQAADHTFCPIRRTKILGLSPSPGEALFAHAIRTELRIEFGNFIEYDAGSDAAIKGIPKRPVPYQRGQAQPGAYYFVLEGDDVLPAASRKAPDDVWEGVAEHVAKSKTLPDGVFLSLGHLRPFASQENCELKAYRGCDKAYHIRPNRIYEVGLRIFEPPSSLEVAVRSSSDLLSPTQPFPTVVGGLGTYNVVITCKRSIEETLAALFVEVFDRASQQPAAQTQTVARPRYLVAVTPPRRLLITFLLCVFAGAFLTSASADFWKEWTSARPQTLALASKILGAVFLSAAAWLAFKKLPSGPS